MTLGALGFGILVTGAPMKTRETGLLPHEVITRRAAQWAEGCTGGRGVDPAIVAAHAELDYAGAVLIANGEIFTGRSAEDLRKEVASLPGWDDSDGVTVQEAAALEQVLQLGRQLMFADAAAAFDEAAGLDAVSVELASNENGITPDVLESIGQGC